MTDMVERVARALCDDTLKRWRSPIALKPEPWREFIPAARAAIEAIREPSEAMISAGVDEHNQQGWNDGTDARKVFSAMIGAALSPLP